MVQKLEEGFGREGGALFGGPDDVPEAHDREGWYGEFGQVAVAEFQGNGPTAEGGNAQAFDHTLFDRLVGSEFDGIGGVNARIRKGPFDGEAGTGARFADEEGETGQVGKRRRRDFGEFSCWRSPPALAVGGFRDRRRLRDCSASADRCDDGRRGGESWRQDRHWRHQSC